MKLLFLRGKLPLDFRPDRLEYKTIDQCEDMWTVLCERLSRHTERTELWYYGAGDKNKKKHVTDKFVERWMNFDRLPGFQPDIVIARGGFPEYIPVCNKYPKAKKVYYGAGTRFKPSGGKWDLVLVDSKRQQRKVPGSKLFIKPAADNMFKPSGAAKKYDICFMANATQAEIKRHRLAFTAIKDLSILHLGLVDKKIKKWAGNNVTFGGWHRRHDLPGLISQCRIGLVCSTPYDSCPRVLPEYLACGLPVVATENMNFWHEKCINEHTGILANDDNLLESAKSLISKNLDVSQYYKDNLSVDVSASRIMSLL